MTGSLKVLPLTPEVCARAISHQNFELNTCVFLCLFFMYLKVVCFVIGMYHWWGLLHGCQIVWFPIINCYWCEWKKKHRITWIEYPTTWVFIHSCSHSTGSGSWPGPQTFSSQHLSLAVLTCGFPRNVPLKSVVESFALWRSYFTLFEGPVVSIRRGVPLYNACFMQTNGRVVRRHSRKSCLLWEDRFRRKGGLEGQVRGYQWL